MWATREWEVGIGLLKKIKVRPTGASLLQSRSPHWIRVHDTDYLVWESRSVSDCGVRPTRSLRGPGWS
jgi:hypothetical protein